MSEGNIDTFRRFKRHNRVANCGITDPLLATGAARWRSDTCRTIKLIAVAIIPVFVLNIQNLMMVKDATTVSADLIDLKSSINLSLSVGLLIHALEVERGMSAFYISSERNTDIYKRLLNRYNETDSIFVLSNGNLLDKREVIEQTDSTYIQIQAARLKSIDLNGTSLWYIDIYTFEINKLLGMVEEMILSVRDEKLWRHLISYLNLILGKESFGLERAFGSRSYTLGVLSSETFSDYCARRAEGNAYLLRSKQFSTTVRDFLNKTYDNTSLQSIIENMRKEIIQNNRPGSVEMGGNWFDNMTEYIDLLKTVQDKLVEEIIAEVDTALSAAQQQLVVSVLVMTGTFLLFPIVVVLVARLTKTIHRYAETLKGKTNELEIERRKSELLLYEILPVSVAQKLLTKESVVPEQYASATIFFSDIVAFTEIASKSTPLQVVGMLNLLYEAFDDRLELYDVYKVETIGDSYMVASGLPQRNGEQHSAEISLLSLDLLESIAAMRVPHMRFQRLQLRIGINTGSVVAGVVGHKMPRYCLFGDTVNTASRMESCGLPSKIQITSATYQSLENDHAGFYMEERGEIEVKGKGKMVTYLLTGKDSRKHKNRTKE